VGLNDKTHTCKSKLNPCSSNAREAASQSAPAPQPNDTPVGTTTQKASSNSFHQSNEEAADDPQRAALRAEMLRLSRKTEHWDMGVVDHRYKEWLTKALIFLEAKNYTVGDLQDFERYLPYFLNKPAKEITPPQPKFVIERIEQVLSVGRRRFEIATVENAQPGHLQPAYKDTSTLFAEAQRVIDQKRAQIAARREKDNAATALTSNAAR